MVKEMHKRFDHLCRLLFSKFVPEHDLYDPSVNPEL